MIVMFLAVNGSFVTSWIPLTTIDANIITAAPPRTLCGMIEINAASFGNRPQNTRKIAPIESAKRFTTFVIATRPTFWLKDVFGSTPKIAAKEEPRPSHITPPASSVSVASLPIPPSITPEISPTVSTAVTMNIIITGTIARRSNTGFTGKSCGIEIHAASFTFCQFNTHAFVYSTPSAVTAVVSRNIGIIAAIT